jgi:hypothetical protein
MIQCKYQRSQLINYAKEINQMDELQEHQFYNEDTDPPPTRQKLSDRPINIVSVVIQTELDCDPAQGEYGLYISGFIGSLDTNAQGGVYVTKHKEIKQCSTITK